MKGICGLPNPAGSMARGLGLQEMTESMLRRGRCLPSCGTCQGRLLSGAAVRRSLPSRAQSSKPSLNTGLSLLSTRMVVAASLLIGSSSELGSGVGK